MSRRFSDQFKQSAVQMVSSENSIAQVAQRLGIGHSTLDKWVRAHRRQAGQLVMLNQEQKRIRELERQFAVNSPNRVWVSDITYLRTTQGWLYLAVLIDLFSRLVVGWQMSKRIDAKLLTDALDAAMLMRGKPQGVLIHSDRGRQYCSAAFVQQAQSRAKHEPQGQLLG